MSGTSDDATTYRSFIILAVGLLITTVAVAALAVMVAY
jgi:hypothetical protein